MPVANETGKPAATRGAAGPRNRAGKKRPSAFKHGLAGAVPFAQRAEAERLAARFARNNPDEGRRAMAAIAAEAELELRRVEEAKCALVDAAFSAAGAASGDAAEAEAIAAAATSLLPFRRYEAQARARRRRALQFL